ncbi:hypothetical protein SLEP1_g6269 [Rubroshorea leprosula]|uniref:Uncharacterized protein n=1 Tax=Rubroshorea leprosula TaxID=152421 RepID=A0AAV5HUM5_9ROSI|nr:hypothetical protein SLEP1_g6269 [Rubroshorea leprosula]
MNTELASTGSGRHEAGGGDCGGSIMNAYGRGNDLWTRPLEGQI